jgi:hypothetical protein
MDVARADGVRFRPPRPPEEHPEVDPRGDMEYKGTSSVWSLRMSLLPRLRAPASLACTAALLSIAVAPLPAAAGGIGLITTTGAHADRIYGYTLEANGEYTQDEPVTQFNGHFGGGLELILGDKDDKVSGVFRGYYLADAPQTALDTDVSPVRTDVRNIGMASAGLQWGVLGSPDTLQMTVVANAGAGVFTSDLTEFMMVEAGVGGTWMAARRVQVVGAATAGARYRKRVYPTMNATVGVRYLFD